jgi:hypothetical protein
MRLLGYLLAGVLLAGSSASAQVSSPSSLLPSTDVTYLATNSTSAAEPDPAVLSSEPPAPEPQRSVIGVFQEYSFQVAVGYTFLRFYEAPNMTQNRNGFNSTVNYFFNKGPIGVEGSLLGAFGSQSVFRSRFAFVGGGGRYRWSAPRDVDIWVHGLVGRNHYTPQTAFGNQGAFGYELGGGVDINAHHQRLAYRLEANMIGSSFFNTQQLSPMGAVSVVWKF